MTQAQVDLQNQLEQATADLTTRPLLNDSPVLYIDTSEPIPTTSLEQMEQEKSEHDTSKVFYSAQRYRSYTRNTTSFEKTI